MTRRSAVPVEVQSAVDVIKAAYGDTVSVEGKSKHLDREGSRDDVGIDWVTIGLFAGTEANESYVSSNLITYAVSADATADQTIDLEGHQFGSPGLDFVAQQFTLNGHTPIELDIPLGRADFTKSVSPNTLLDLMCVYQGGDVVDGVPVVDSEVHLMIPVGSNRSFKASSSLSNVDYWIITTDGGNVFSKQPTTITFRLEVREAGEDWIVKDSWTCSTPGSTTEDRDQNPVIIIRPNSDVRIIGRSATAIGTGNTVTASMSGYMAIR